MNRTPVCYIVCALPQNHPFQPESGDLVIAADGGYAQMGGVRADLVVGDFDSLGYVPESENVVRHPVEKDDTDTMLAARIGLDRGYRAFLLLGVEAVFYPPAGVLQQTTAGIRQIFQPRFQGFHGGDRRMRRGFALLPAFR